MAKFRKGIKNMALIPEIYEPSATEGWLYELWRGQLRIREGTVFKRQWSPMREAIFKYGTLESGDWVKCNAEPGKLLQARVWLRERNDAQGCRLLIEYYEGNIERLEKQIEGYRANIKFLKDWEEDILDEDT